MLSEKGGQGLKSQKQAYLKLSHTEGKLKAVLVTIYL